MKTFLEIVCQVRGTQLHLLCRMLLNLLDWHDVHWPQQPAAAVKSEIPMLWGLEDTPDVTNSIRPHVQHGMPLILAYSMRFE